MVASGAVLLVGAILWIAARRNRLDKSKLRVPPQRPKDIQAGEMTTLTSSASAYRQRVPAARVGVDFISKTADLIFNEAFPGLGACHEGRQNYR
jgi:hypothetical protein